MAKKQPKKVNKGKIKESEKCHEAENENENEAEDGEGAGGDDGAHDDAGKDKELIKKMINEYLGEGAKKLSKEESEALHDLGKQAHQGHMAMGKKEDEAYQHAGEAVKLAHHLSSKKKEDESESEAEDEGDPKKKPAPKADATDDDDGDSSEAEGEESEKESENDENEESEKKESKRVRELKNKLLETEGRLASLEAKDKKREVDGYVDAKLKESGQPVSVTKRFREAAGKFKSKGDFDSQWKVFLAGVKDTKNDVDWGGMMEKATSTEDGVRSSAAEGDLDFSDCAE